MVPVPAHQNSPERQRHDDGRPLSGSSSPSGATRSWHGHPGYADSIQGFVDEYARAMTSGDTKKLAELWALPAFVVGAGLSRVVQSREEIEEFFAGAKAQYNAHGIVDTRPHVEDIDWVSQGLVVVKIRWPYFDASGEKLGEECSSYTLERDENRQLRLRVALIRGANKNH